MTAGVANPDDFWVPKRRLTLGQARKRSDLVRFLRMLFTSCAAISAGILIGNLAYSVIQHGQRTEIDKTPNIVTMLNPRFTGRDAAGVPYVITADSAKRNEANAQLVELVNPMLDNGMTGTVRAPTGVFDQGSQQLELFKEVVMTDANGNRFETTHARLFVQENRVEGLEPLVGAGPIGRIKADTYEILDGGERIVFKGNVWTELQSADGDKGEE